MSIYKICEWENNFRDDSDFYIGLYDTEVHKCRSVIIGTTRGGDGVKYPDNLEPLNDEIVEKSRQWLENRWFSTMRYQDDYHVNFPTTLKLGDRITMLESHYNIKKNILCEKCNGTGDWVNPNNYSDVRECFGCYGKGYWRQKNGSRIIVPEKSNGEIIKEQIKQGRYFNYGIKPGRYDYEYLVRFDEEGLILAPLQKMKLERKPYSDEVIRERATKKSYNFEFGRFLGAVAWLTSNEIGYYYDGMKKERC